MEELELKMIKAFAELDGVNLIMECGLLMADLGCGFEIYNPITDLALNCAARDKYGVTVIYKKYGNCIVKIDSLESVIGCGVHIDFVPKAIIECILKSKGKWVE